MEEEQKLKQLADLYDKWKECTACKLCESRNNVVFGDGNHDARLLIIGDAPGELEDNLATPFQGQSGEIVDMFLERCGSSRDEVFIANIVGCRPPSDRAPSKSEIRRCSDRIHKIIEYVDPFVVLILGAVAFKTLLPDNGKISEVAKMRGELDPYAFTLTTPGTMVPIERLALVTWHPAYLLQNWTEKPNGAVHQALVTWKKAFTNADAYGELYLGETPRDREVNIIDT